MKVKAVITLATATNATNLDICEASYQGVNERVLACPGGRIKITGANYGRPADNRDTCCANKKKCGVKTDETCTVSALDWVGSKCNDESECTLFGGMNGVLGDPCRKRHKYLNVQYECDYSTPVMTASFCEARLDNRSNSITCQNQGEVITVKSATWGRSKDSYCCPFKKDHECLSGDCSGSTDSTELMSSICDGNDSCSWDASIAEDVKDPCPDVFKYMSVDYECALPAPAVAPGRNLSGDCEAMMMEAFYKVNAAVGSEWSRARGLHREHFNEGDHDFTDQGNDMTFTGRLAKFSHNMQKWGKRFDNHLCNCPASTTNSIPDINSENDINGFISFMNEAGSAMNCGKEGALIRKMNHAKQILRL